MLQSMGSQRVRQDLVTEQQQQKRGETLVDVPEFQLDSKGLHLWKKNEQEIDKPFLEPKSSSE